MSSESEQVALEEPDSSFTKCEKELIQLLRFFSVLLGAIEERRNHTLTTSLGKGEQGGSKRKSKPWGKRPTQDACSCVTHPR